MARAPRWNHEARLLGSFWFGAMPGLVLAAGLSFHLWGNDWRSWLGVGAAVLLTALLARFLQRNAVYPLYTLTNLLEALREGDYSLRGARARRGDAVGEVILEINALAQTLRDQRLALEEKRAQLAKVLAALDIAVLSFDEDGFLSIANPAAQRLLARSLDQLDGRDAASLGLSGLLEGPDLQVIERNFPSGGGRWETRRTHFRSEGRRQDLLVISDLSRALRDEERLAWQRLLRVLGHELNNSLAPIRSMAETACGLITREAPPPDWRDDAAFALGVIAERADALARFMARYTQLAQLPQPTLRAVELNPLVERIVALEQRLQVEILRSPPLVLDIDPDQIEQALINLIRNAVDASLPGRGEVSLGWRRDGANVIIEIRDNGPGLPSSGNLFVPFFTTKPGGSGIGLVLARQIVEQHGGNLGLRNREDGQGCIAELRLPRSRAST